MVRKDVSKSSKSEVLIGAIMWQALRSQMVPEAFIRLIQDL